MNRGKLSGRCSELDRKVSLSYYRTAMIKYNSVKGREMFELQGGEMNTQERIEKLFVDKLELNRDLLTPASTLESFGIDSLDKIEFLFALEDEFKIKIPERDVKIDTVQDVIDMVDRLVAEQSAKA